MNVVVDGRRIPVTAVVGGACTAILWFALVVLQSDARYLGAAWMVLGLAAYAAYRRRLGLSLTERTPAEAAARRGPGVEVEFQTLLIPVNTAAATPPTDLVDVAAQLAAERRASLVVLAFTEIPLGEEMDMEIDDLDGVVERLAAAGRAIGKQYGIHVHTSHLRTRDPAESILAEANRRDSQVILLRAGGLQRAGPPPSHVRPRRAADRGRGPPARHDRPTGGRDMRHQILIVCADSRVEPELLTRPSPTRSPGRLGSEIKVMRVMAPAVLPATLPISAWPPRLADRLNRLREAAERAAGVAAHAVPGRDRAVPQRLGAPGCGVAGRRARPRREARGGASAAPPAGSRPRW